MTKRIRFALLLATLGMAGVMVSVFRPHAQEVDDNEAPAVSEADLQLYIKVYSAMQENHDLNIETAIAPYQISLDDFRTLERRIQSQRARVKPGPQARPEQEKAHPIFAQANNSPTPGQTPKESKPRRKKQ